MPFQSQEEQRIAQLVLDKADFCYETLEDFNHALQALRAVLDPENFPLDSDSKYAHKTEILKELLTDEDGFNIYVGVDVLDREIFFNQDFRTWRGGYLPVFLFEHLTVGMDRAVLLEIIRDEYLRLVRSTISDEVKRIQALTPEQKNQIISSSNAASRSSQRARLNQSRVNEMERNPPASLQFAPSDESDAGDLSYAEMERRVTENVRAENPGRTPAEIEDIVDDLPPEEWHRLSFVRAEVEGGDSHSDIDNDDFDNEGSAGSNSPSPR